ncbi:MAG: SGNH/GDSL hydrolase family protein [Eubacteriales bacterium]|nr:SGNH/GDSL hydrolase family protein [Eubacteriales bacterium]
MLLRGKKIVVIGDSITEGVGASSPEKRFTDVLASLIGADVYNYGIGGTGFGVVSKTGGVFADRCRTVPNDENVVDIIIVFGGTNDFAQSKLGMGNDGECGNFSVIGGMTEVFTTLKKRFPRALVIAVSPLRRQTETVCNYISGYDLDAIYRALKSVCEKMSVPMLDLYSGGNMYARIDERNKAYFTDGLHPNDLGHRLIAERIAGFLRVL